MSSAQLERFIVIGENLHASRALSSSSRRLRAGPDGIEAVGFFDRGGEPGQLAVPDWYRASAAYRQGKIQHLLIALRQGLEGSAEERQRATELIGYEARRQLEAGARYLDLNVDQISPVLEQQQAAMRWLVHTVQAAASAPLCLDSSNPRILAAGLEACDRRAGRPLLNSAALDRPEVLELASEHDAGLIVSASGVSGLPADAGERIANLDAMLARAQRRGIAQCDLYVDPLVLPTAVDARQGAHFLDSVRALRKTYGAALHISGGLSNVSFGLPGRKLANRVFAALAIEAGCDSAILDPCQIQLAEVAALDFSSEPVRLARAMLLGEDPHCSRYIRAWRHKRRGAEHQPAAEAPT